MSCSSIIRPNYSCKNSSPTSTKMDVLVFLGALKAYLKLTTRKCTCTVAKPGKTVLISGASNGPGYYVAKDLATKGARIVIADQKDVEKIRDKLIDETENPNIVAKKLNLYSLQSVRDFAEDFQKTESRLDLLIHHDHIAGLGRGQRTEDGLLKVVQYNHLSPFLLTYLLMDMLKANANSRVIFRSNLLAFFHKINSPEDVNASPNFRTKFWHDFFEYSNCSACILMTMHCFADMLKSHGVHCVCCHPGFVDMSLFDMTKDIKYSPTDRVRAIIFGQLIPALFKFYRRSHRDGAWSAIHCATLNDFLMHDYSGAFVSNCKPIYQPPSAQRSAFRYKIFQESIRLVSSTSGNVPPKDPPGTAATPAKPSTTPPKHPPGKSEGVKASPTGKTMNPFNQSGKMGASANPTPKSPAEKPPLDKNPNEKKDKPDLKAKSVKNIEPDGSKKFQVSNESKGLFAKILDRLFGSSNEAPKKLNESAKPKSQPKTAEKIATKQDVSKIAAKIEALKSMADKVEGTQLKMDAKKVDSKTSTKSETKTIENVIEKDLKMNKPAQNVADAKPLHHTSSPLSTQKTSPQDKATTPTVKSSSPQQVSTLGKPSKIPTPNTAKKEPVTVQDLKIEKAKIAKPENDLQSIMQYKGWATEAEEVPAGPKRKGLIGARDQPRKKTTRPTAGPAKHRGLKW